MSKKNKELKEILEIDDEFMQDAKMHLAVYNQDLYPKNVIQKSWCDWIVWQESEKRKQKERWGRCKYIISFVDNVSSADKDKDNVFVFGGIFEFLGKKEKGEDYSDGRPHGVRVIYNVRLIDDHPSNKLIGKLHIKHNYNARAKEIWARTFFDEYTIETEIKESILSYDPIEEEYKRKKTI